jgi:DNA polymerase-1
VLAFYLLTLLNHGELAQRALSDVHQLNADAWSCSRPAAKRGIFATVYGVGPAKLARVIRTNVNNAKSVLSAIRRDLRLDEYTDCFVEHARNNDGFIVNYFGLRMYIPELLSRDRNEREAGRRKCGNYPIQSTAGTLFKYMQIAARNVINESSTLAPNVMQTLVVHDEVIYLVKNDYVNEFIARVTPCYNSSTLLPGVNVALEFGVGKNWYEAK